MVHITLSQVYKIENADKSVNSEKTFEDEVNENKIENVEESLLNLFQTHI